MAMLCQCAMAHRRPMQRAQTLRVVSDHAISWRGLHSVCHPRFHRRQLPARRSRPSSAKWKRSRTGCLRRRSPATEVHRLYTLRRELLQLRNAAAPLAEVCRRLEHAEVMPIDAKCSRSSVTSVTTSPGEGGDRRSAGGPGVCLRGEPDGRAAQQTAITRRLAAWAAILAVPTAVAGIYGMNFEHMPELNGSTDTSSCWLHRCRLRHDVLAAAPQRLAVKARGAAGRPGRGGRCRAAVTF